MTENSEAGLPDIRIPIIGSRISRRATRTVSGLDHRIGQVGLSVAVSELLEKRGVRYRAEYDDQEATKTTLCDQPALLLGNHTDLLGTYSVITLLPPRKDLKVFANSDFLSIGENFNRHVLPVYGIGNYDTTNRRSQLWQRYGFSEHAVSVLTAGRLNSKILKSGIERLNAGGLVVLWPDGGQGRGAKWLPGVGDLAMGSREDPSFRIIFFSGNIDYKDLIRSEIRGSGFSGTVRFSKPLTLSELCVESTRDRKIVTSELQKKYDEWLIGLTE